MSTEIDQSVANALEELVGDMAKKPYPTGQDTYICDMAYHALHCFSCSWAGVVFDFADLTDLDHAVTGLLFIPRTQALCPQCGRSIKRASRQDAEPPKPTNDRHGLRLAGDPN